MRDLEANIVPLVVIPVDAYTESVFAYYADIDLAGQARRLALVIDVKLGVAADIDILIVQTDTTPGDDEETILTETIDADGGYGFDFTPTKRFVTVYFTVNTDECLISCGGLAYLLRQIPEAESLIQVL